MIIVLLVLSLLVVAPAWAGHRNFVWTAPTTNADGTPLTDLASYRLYTCLALPCSRANGTVLSTVVAPSPSPTPGTTALFPVTHGTRGQAFVTAVDTSGNESTESNVFPFDLVPPTAIDTLTVQ